MIRSYLNSKPFLRIAQAFNKNITRICKDLFLKVCQTYQDFASDQIFIRSWQDLTKDLKKKHILVSSKFCEEYE